MNSIPRKRFWLLRRLAKALTVTAWVVFALVLLVTPVGVARALLIQDWADSLEWVKYGVSGLLIFVNLLFVAQSIQVILAIEENTKHATLILEKLTTLTQQIRDQREGAAETGVKDAAGPVDVA
jgi:hypothetical protein